MVHFSIYHLPFSMLLLERRNAKGEKTELYLPLRRPGVLLRNMPRLSNFFRPRDQEADAPVPTLCRQAQRQEIEPALRLILVNEQGLASDQVVLEFLGFALQRGIDVNQSWVALSGQQIVWSLLPIVSPGRTMLLFTPARLPRGTPVTAVRQLTNAICGHFASEQVQLAQFLLDPHDTAVRDLYLSCGFETLAELVYLHKIVKHVPTVDLPAGYEIVHYTPATHAAFAQAILRSYEGSLDCPALNGLRDIEDVIAGHKATGGFEPSLWHLMVENGQPRGVLILSPPAHTDSLELVYLGLSAAARGRGLGATMMRLAMHCVLQQQRKELSLAVDAKNQPALRLYYRHGLQRVGSRLALIRDLRLLRVEAEACPAPSVNP